MAFWGGVGGLGGDTLLDFAVSVDGRLLTGRDAGWTAASRSAGEAVFQRSGSGIEVTVTARRPAPEAAVERALKARNMGSSAVHITRLDTVHAALPKGVYTLSRYNSGWGGEFAPVSEPLSKATTLEVRSGRSSNGMHPWFALSGEGGVLTGAVAWSGNWAIRFEPDGEGWVVSGGLHDTDFERTLHPGETIEAPVVWLAAGEDRDTCARQMHAAMRSRRPRCPLSDALLVEWNHWWPYEDVEIADAVFRANAAEAARMGCGVVTLDAGWFGGEGDTRWGDVRGDWDLVNTKRFPNGIRALADDAHARGLKFGLWCEVEAIGPKARLATEKPELVARRDGQPLGYVCLGSPAGRAFADATLDRLITEYAADWIKVDFNLDPGAGCNRTDHGHGPGDGLYEHIRGLYALLDGQRKKHPNVLFEGCASGGLRLDPGLLSHVHACFLSDPDYPVHNLQLMWGALDYLAPEAALHWAWSENRGAFTSFDPNAETLTPEALDFAVRSGMMGFFGLSQRLPDLPLWVRQRFARHIAVYRREVAPLLPAAQVHRLAGQPTREGGGDRWCVIQYASPAKDRAVIFVFRLPGGEASRTLRLKGLDPSRTYRLAWEMSEVAETMISGRQAMEQGLTFNALGEGESALVTLKAGPER
jgi:alpha-galactosidase